MPRLRCLGRTAWRAGEVDTNLLIAVCAIEVV